MRKTILLLCLLTLGFVACEAEETPDSHSVDDSPTLRPSATFFPDVPTQPAGDFTGRSNPTQAALAAEGQPSVVPTEFILPTEAVLPMQVFASDGALLDVNFYAGRDVNAPLVFLLHDGGEEVASWDAFAKHLQNLGYHVVVPRLRAIAEAPQVMDVQVILANLNTLGTINANVPVAMAGVGDGGSLAIAVCAVELRCATSIAISPTEGKITDLANIVGTMTGKSLLLVSADDDSVNVAFAQTLDSRYAGEHVWQRYASGGTGGELFGTQPQLTQQLRDWLLAKIPLPVTS